MRDLSIIIAFLAIVLVACGEKDKDCEKDTDSAKATDVANLPDDATKTKGEDTKYLCYVGCLEAEASSKECKKLCYGDKKLTDCKTCYDKCVKAGKKVEDCKKGCCPEKSEPDAGASLPEDASSTKK